jgi:predicted acylesterase/phospholipase RssA
MLVTSERPLLIPATLPHMKTVVRALLDLLRISRRDLCVTTIAVLITTSLSGCEAMKRLPALNDQSSEATPVGFAASARIVEGSAVSFRVHSVDVIDRLRASADGGEINILALSGGGAGGAFGAGALVGLSDSGSLPKFHLVTGVSTGALIAPFAFLGPDWNRKMREAFTGERAQHLLRPSYIRLLFGSTLYDGEALTDLVGTYVTDEVITRVAEESRRGRMLLVQTTDLDKAEPVMWNLGEIAMHGGPAAKRLFRDVLVASASIPTLFPPVLIRVEKDGVFADELHVDGGTSTSLFIAPEIAPVVSGSFAGADRINVYVVVNGQLESSPKTTRTRSMDILWRSVSTNLQHSARASVALAFNVARSHNMNFRFTAIPGYYPYGGPLDTSNDAMTRLFRFAELCAGRNLLWKTPEDTYTIATPVGALTNGDSACPSAMAVALAGQLATR